MTIEQIYWGAVPFVIIQILMVALIITFPGIVTTGGDKGPKLDADQLLQQMDSSRDSTQDIERATRGGAAASEAASETDREDPMKGLLDSIKSDQQKAQKP